MIQMKPKKKPRVSGPIDPDKLAGFVKRIEAVEEEQAERKAAKADLYTEVKSSGLKAKLVRKIIKERAKKADDAAEQEELDLYRHALGMPGATYRSVAERYNVPKSTLHRLVPREKNGTPPPHDPDTGEITESAVPETPPGEGTGTTAASGPGSALASNPDQPSIMPAPTVWHEVTSVWQAAEAERKAAREAERERRRAAHAALAAKNAAIDADPLIPPPHLDRRQKVAA